MKFLVLFFILFSQVHANELIVFLGDKDKGSIDLKSKLKDIKKIAKQKKITVKIIKSSNSLPKKIKFLPSLYFQNYKGRSLYLGRYNNFEKIKKFLQAAKYVLAPDDKIQIKDALLIEKENFNVFVRLKITELSGTIPSDFDSKAFQKKLSSQLIPLFNEIVSKNKAIQETGDRTFYFDIYPWRGKDNKLVLNLAIFSQFDCHNPVYKTSSPLSGNFDNPEKLLFDVAKTFESELNNVLKNSTDGDAINFDLKGINRVSWEELGLHLPKKNLNNTEVDLSQIKLTRKWVYIKKKSDKNKPAAVFFNFPAPLEHYSGEVRESAAYIVLSEDLKFENVSGKGKVKTRSLAMGSSLLNSSARGEIDARDFPDSKLEIKKLNFIDPETGNLKLGNISTIQGEGIFYLKDKSVPVKLLGEVGFILGNNLEGRLFLNFKYRVNTKKAFGISGPDDSTRANDFMDFNILMEMEPYSKKSESL